jgi:hypothetical protein
MQTKKSSIIRTYSAGVFIGEVVNREDLQSGLKVKLQNARRVWYWDGANSLSDLAVNGINPKKVHNCKFPPEVPSIELSQVIEIIEMTEKAINSVNSIPEWTQ